MVAAESETKWLPMWVKAPSMLVDELRGQCCVCWEFVKPRGRNSGQSCAVASRPEGVKSRGFHTISSKKFVRCSVFAREMSQVCGDQKLGCGVKWDALHCRIVSESEFGGLGTHVDCPSSLHVCCHVSSCHHLCREEAPCLSAVQIETTRTFASRTRHVTARLAVPHVLPVRYHLLSALLRDCTCPLPPTTPMNQTV